jgi:hypothetical protein
MNVIIRFSAACLLPVIVGYTCKWINAEPIIPSILVVFGSLSFFLGPLFTGTGMMHIYNGGREVNAATPGCVWKGFGLFLWVVALGVVIASSTNNWYPDD